MNPHLIRRTGLALIALAVFCFLFVFVLLAGAQTPDQAARWRAARVDPRRVIELDKLIVRYRQNAAVYQRVQAMRSNGVPAPVIFGLHYRESDNSFSHSLAQGDPLTHRSRNVPRGRIPGVNPPYTWEQCAIDAVYNVDRLDLTDWSRVSASLQAIESYNGLGYQRRGVPSPYLWGATSLYGVAGAARGKYVADGRFDPAAVDKQAGVAAILLRMRERGIPLPEALQ